MRWTMVAAALLAGGCAGATDVPYVSLWSKTNYAVAQPDLTGISLSATADFGFLKDVARTK